MTGTSAPRPALFASTARPIARNLLIMSPGGVLGIAPLIMEADQIGEGVVAKDHVQRFVAALDAPGAIQHLGVPHVPLPVARNPTVGRFGEDLFVGRDPLDARLGNRRDDVLRHRSLGGPHADRRLAEQSACAARRPAAGGSGRPRDSCPGAWAARSRASPGARSACPTAAAGSDGKTAWSSARPARSRPALYAAESPR